MCSKFTKTQVDWLIRWLTALAWLGVIYFGSSQQGRAAVDSYWLDWLIKKSLHLLEYGLLAILWWRSLRLAGLGIDGRLWVWLTVLWFAGSDELHQLTVPGRTGRTSDVVIDLFGAGLGLYLMPRVWKKLRASGMLGT